VASAYKSAPSEALSVLVMRCPISSKTDPVKIRKLSVIANIMAVFVFLLW